MAVGAPGHAHGARNGSPAASRVRVAASTGSQSTVPGSGVAAASMW
jgi:hypothetical protein